MGNENQKPVTDAYREGWDNIFGRKTYTVDIGETTKEECKKYLEKIKENFQSTFASKAYGGCQCECHRNSNVVHCVPCCYPGREDDFIGEQLCSQLKKVKLQQEIVIIQNQSSTLETIMFRVVSATDYG